MSGSVTLCWHCGKNSWAGGKCVSCGAVETPLTPAEFEEIIATSLKGFFSAIEPTTIIFISGHTWLNFTNLDDPELHRRLAQHLRGNLWMALQSKGVLPL